MAGSSELLVRDLMSKGAHLAAPSDTVGDVHHLMRLGGIRHLPVVERGRLVGVVSDRDVLAAWMSGGATRIEEVMTRTPRWVSQETPARDAAGLLLRHKIGCLPVVDAAMTVVGIVTESDFVELAHRALSPTAPGAEVAPS